jgi:TATA-box binding protein (TBP) (component of TFIID and TFIIIB)
MTTIKSEFELLEPKMVRIPPQVPSRASRRSRSKAVLASMHCATRSPTKTSILEDIKAVSKAVSKKPKVKKLPIDCLKSDKTCKWVTRTTPEGVTLSFPNFDSIKPYTHTIVACMNVTIDTEKMFYVLPITDYIVVPKRRGRKKKDQPADPNSNIPDGSIITLKMVLLLRGVNLSKKKRTSGTGTKTYFRNSVTIVMYSGGKQVNMKVSKNGNVQMTGCRTVEQAHDSVKMLWDYIRGHPDIYKFDENVTNKSVERVSETKSSAILSKRSKHSRSEIRSSIAEFSRRVSEDARKTSVKSSHLKVIFVPAMRNIFFNMNFFVDRIQLDRYFNSSTNYYSLLEPTIGYTGVNIKIPMISDLQDLVLDRFDNIDGKWEPLKKIPYGDYIDILTQKEVTKKQRKQRYSTFLVFHSGKIIMSGMEASYMRDVYYEFLDIVAECHYSIEERLKLDKPVFTEILEKL